MVKFKMVCTACSEKIYMCMFLIGVCCICGKSFISSHSPANKLCNNCSKENEVLCESCGKDIVEISSNDIRKETIDLNGGVRLTHIPSGINYSHTGETLER